MIQNATSGQARQGAGVWGMRQDCLQRVTFCASVINPYLVERRQRCWNLDGRRRRGSRATRAAARSPLGARGLCPAAGVDPRKREFQRLVDSEDEQLVRLFKRAENGRP